MQSNTTKKVLVVGCGGLGSEIIKLLIGMDIKPEIIDFDIVEISNLNRQFYFVKSDKSLPKSQVIGKKTNCNFKICKIEELEAGYLNNFDIVFSCLDSVASRMELNYQFINSTSKLMIDCGVEGTKSHIKKVFKSNLSLRSSSCLYCIKDIYSSDSTPFICSVADIKSKITPENRLKILTSLIFKVCGDSEPRHENKLSSLYFEVMKIFNKNTPLELKTSIFEIKGIAEHIIPNGCWINSMCASYAIILAFKETEEDFFYFDGESNSNLTSVKIEKDENCFICKNIS